MVTRTESSLPTAAIDRYLSLHETLHAVACLCEQIRELWDHLHERLAESLRFGPPDKPLCRSVENADAAFRVDADHAGGRSRQYSFGETTTTIDEIASAHDVIALRAQLLGHLIEGLAQLANPLLSAWWAPGHKGCRWQQSGRRRSAFEWARPDNWQS